MAGYLVQRELRPILETESDVPDIATESSGHVRTRKAGL